MVSRICLDIRINSNDGKIKFLVSNYNWTLDSGLSEAARVITWNRRFLKCVGIWPLTPCDPLFILSATYNFIHCTLGFLELMEKINDFDYVVANITENVLFLMTFLKICFGRFSRNGMRAFLRIIEDDFLTKSYKNMDEKLAFLRYNTFSLRFLRIFIIACTGTAVLYYFKVFIINEIGTRTENSTTQFLLPYRIRPIVKINSRSVHICVCAYQSLQILIFVCGYVASDSFCVCMTLHVCGQFAALSCKITHTLENSLEDRREVRGIILRHYKLIKLGETLEYHFNMMFLMQLLGTSLLLCLTSYNTIMNAGDGGRTDFITFTSFAVCLLAEFFAYCYMGDRLANESMAVSDAFYNSKWYDLPPSLLSTVHICMIRAKKPVVLTSGKFSTLCLATYTDILKTSMAYLSFLRNSV